MDVPEVPITRPVTQPQVNKDEKVGSLPEYEQAEVDKTAKTEAHSLHDSARPAPLVCNLQNILEIKFRNLCAWALDSDFVAYSYPSTFRMYC